MEWPTENAGLCGARSVNGARAEPPRIADGLQATIVGPPVSATSRGELVAAAPAIGRQVAA
ncbi:hypothetical protein [Actinoplanes sp. URMC 104]|uniref:hypothetical protein n=1 Tax=Actinoplanes sp. URMC 104 TaxID=3423409 RepID=UPI003F1AB624